MEAILLGLMAGVAPSPHNMTLLGLAIEEEFKKCLRFTFEALLFDILLIAIILFQKEWIEILTPYIHILRLISLNYILFLCFRFMQSKPGNVSKVKTNGFVIQSLNPNPYMFWLLIGFPFLAKEGVTKFLVFSGLFLLITYSTKIIIVLFFQSLQNSRFFNIAKTAIGLVMLIMVNYSFFKVH